MQRIRMIQKENYRKTEKKNNWGDNKNNLFHDIIYSLRGLCVLNEQLKPEEISTEVKLELLKICNDVMNNIWTPKELIKDLEKLVSQISLSV